MKKYAIKDSITSIVFNGRYTYKENAQRDCDIKNKFSSYNEYEVILKNKMSK